MANITKDQMIEAISGMTVLELSELVKALEEKFGVTAAAPMAMMPGMGMPVAAVAAEPVEEKTTFDVEILDAGPNKIQVIKAVREVTSLGLKEAKDAVEKLPSVIKEGVPKEEAAKIKEKFEKEGAKVNIK
jgi:large subunit ribosomal protein L7/L12